MSAVGHQVEDLPLGDLEALARFLLRRMNLETRKELMAAMPVVYARVYPDVSQERILAQVAAALSPPAAEAPRAAGPAEGWAVTSGPAGAGFTLTAGLKETGALELIDALELGGAALAGTPSGRLLDGLHAELARGTGLVDPGTG